MKFSQNLPLLLFTSAFLSACVPRSYNDESETKMFHKDNLMGSHFGLGANEVVLTFDDGPSLLSLPLGEFLASKGVKAHWFINYENASDLDNKGAQNIVKRLCELGHHVGNHNYGHTYNTNIWNKLSGVHQKIRDLCPQQKIVYYRAPGGGWKPQDTKLNEAKDHQGQNVGTQYIGPVFWDVACDTESKPTACQSKDAQTLANAYYDLIIQKSKSAKGVIVLGHDVPWHSATVKAFKDTNLIDRLKSAGMKFVLLDKNPEVTSTLLGAPYNQTPPKLNLNILAKGRALGLTKLKKSPRDSTLLKPEEICDLKTGLTIGFNHIEDVGSKHYKISVDIPSSGCDSNFWTIPHKDVYIYSDHFLFLPRKCNVISKENTNIRSSANVLNDNKIGEIKFGEIIVPEGEEGNFYIINFENKKGYIHKSQLNEECKHFPI